MNCFRRVLAIIFLCLCVPVSQVDGEDLLNAGSKAPDLEIAHWVTNAGGTRKEVQHFKAGSVYVVEFWATWYSPCIAGMPHLANLQQQYSDQPVQIIGVSDEDLDTVNAFLTRDFGGKKSGKTYADICGRYSLTTDPDGSVNDDYMKAAKQEGIPTAFVVGKTGLIEWIGHPQDVDDVLHAVVHDSWDRKSFAKSFAEETRIQNLSNELRATMKKDGLPAALTLANKVIAETPGDLRIDARAARLEFMLRKAPQQAIGKLPEFLSEADANTWSAYAGTVEYVRMRKNRGLKLQAFELMIADHSAALDKAEDADEKAWLTSSLASLALTMKRLDLAIEYQEQAIELATGELKPRLKRELVAMKERQEATEQKEEEKPEPLEEQRTQAEARLKRIAREYSAQRALAESSPPIQKDSKGSGAIRYAQISDGRMARVDTYAIPLTELKVSPGNEIKLGAVVPSTEPDLRLTSPKQNGNREVRYACRTSWKMLHKYRLRKPGGDLTDRISCRS